MDNQNSVKKKWYRTWWAYSLYVLFAVSAVVASVDDPKNTAQPVANNPAPVVAAEPKHESPAKPVVDKVAAQKELDSLMNLSKQAKLVISYEFSDTANVVYIDSGWYTQTVEFKKNFLAKISGLKEQVTGYHRFEVRDAYSNEKVAEVTAFSGSLEVYK
jgi:hypothetical protein